MACSTRRRFLQSAAIGAAALAAPSSLTAAQKRSATDWVTLGNSGVKVTRLAFGTGTFGGRIQRELGQAQFTRLVRHAYDRGIRFFESADSYEGMHEMLAEALKGIPRDTYRLMTKMRLRESDPPLVALDRFRREMNSEYFDIVLMHCVRTPDWYEQFKPLRDGLAEAKNKKVIASHGASCHGLLPLRAFPDTRWDNQWLDVALLRINHDGTRMDTFLTESSEKGNVPEVVSRIQAIKSQGKGVLGMKLMGEGRFTTPEQRDMAIRFVMKLGTVDAVTIGFKTTAEIDEALERINTHLNA
jgi:aryl-alcohol dehydrogenase-like predicted oxidoreductase